MVVRTRRCRSQDTNIWLALRFDTCTYRASRVWLDTINAPGVIHFCRATQQSLLRLLTNRRCWARGSPPLTNREAWAPMPRSWMTTARAGCAEPDGLEAQWRASCHRQSLGAQGLDVDAYLAVALLRSCDD